MPENSRRNFLVAAGAVAATAAVPALVAEQRQRAGAQSQAGSHVHGDVFYFFGTGANDGYPANDQVAPSDPFERHVSRTMEALKKTLESHGCTMDSILQLQVFLCLAPAEGTLSGKALFEAHQAQYEALNRIYHPYFTGPAPSRACMAVDWIPGNSLIEIVGSAVITDASHRSEE